MMSCSKSKAESASWYCAILLVAMIVFIGSIREVVKADEEEEGIVTRGKHFGERACDEIYVVGEGETLHTIGDKCGDPFIVEQNPHIHDPDDVFPGLVIKITPPSQH